MFAEAGYAPVSPGWPDDPDTVAEANADPGLTEFAEIPGRGHSLTIDVGWRTVADTALAFITRFI